MSDDVTIIPMMGALPHSHMGHRYDLGEKLAKLPGKKLVGISAKPDILGIIHRRTIIQNQWAGIDCEFVIVESAGMTAHLARQYHGKNLHILVGHDRLKKLGQGMKNSLEAGKIKEMDGKMFDSITLHTPDDNSRSHGLSGTRMRNAIADNDFDTYLEHYGEYSLEAEALWSLNLRPAYERGELIIKRR